MNFSKSLEVDSDADLSEIMTAPPQSVEERQKADKAAVERRRKIEDMRRDKLESDPFE